MIKYKIREEDQVKRHTRGICSIDTLQWQCSEEWVDGLSPHVPEYAHFTTLRRLDILLDIKDQLLTSAPSRKSMRMTYIITDRGAHWDGSVQWDNKGHFQQLTTFVHTHTHLSGAAFHSDETGQTTTCV
jgi:hypothetical protein